MGKEKRTGNENVSEREQETETEYVPERGRQAGIGSILDGRYEIRTVLDAEQGRFRYQAWHSRIGREVLICELPGDGGERERYLAKARRLGDFTDLNGICHVRDQFEEAGKAYVVFEWPEGIRLSDYEKDRARIPEEELAQMIYPLAADLARLEKAGVADLPVTPALLYRNDRGVLSLLPDICGQDGRRSGGYAYALCEILYEGHSGRRPPSRMLRILFDEMEPLETCNAKGDAAFQKIVEKGLRLDQGQSYRDCGELAQALSSWLLQRRQQKKERNYRKAGAALLLAAAMLLVILLCRRYEEQIKFWGIQTETLRLTPPDEMTQSGYIQALQVIERRAEKLAGGGAYLVKEKQGSAEVVLPLERYENAFENREELRVYLTRPLKLSLAVGDEYIAWMALQRGQYVTLEREDILSVAEETIRPVQSFSADEMLKRMLVVELSERGAEKLRNTLEPWLEQEGMSLFACLDAGEQDFARDLEYAYQDHDWHTLRIPENRFFAMAQSELTEETFDAVFAMDQEIQAVWLDPISEKAVCWVKGTQIGEPAVTMEYSCEEDWQKNEGDYYYNLSDLAERLETLGVPYAIGTAGENLVLRMRQADMSEFLMKILCGHGTLYLKDQWGNREMLSDAEIVPEMREGEDSGWHVIFRGTSESIRKFVQNAGKKQQTIYLCCQNDKLAELKLTQIPEMKEDRYDLFFTEMLLGDGKVTEEMNRVVEFLNVINRYGNMKSSFSLEIAQYSSSEAKVGDRQTSRSEWELAGKRRSLQKVQKQIREIDGYAEAAAKEGYSGEEELHIMLHMDVNEDYAEKAMARIEMIVQLLQADESSWDRIVFWIGEKNEYPAVFLYRNGEEECWEPIPHLI